MGAYLETSDNRHFTIRGDLDFKSVPKLWQNTEALLRTETEQLHIDLASIKRCDSSGVALLVDWLRQARSRGKQLDFINIPPQMQAIIQVADLEKILPIP